MNTADARLHKLAASQHSVVSRKQALSLGLTPRQVERRIQSGALEVAHTGVYRLVGSRRTYEQRLMAACLATGGLVSHRAATALWNLRGIENAPVEITIPLHQRPRLSGVVVHRSGLLLPEHVTRRDGIPVAKPALALFQLAAVAPQLLEGAAEDAIFRKLTSITGLWHVLDQIAGPGARGAGVLRALLTARDPALAPTESKLEDEIVAVLRRFHLPEPTRQHPVSRPNGKPIRLDVAYPEALLDIEGDGLRWHLTTRDMQRDRDRANYLVALGWSILRYTRDDVRHRAAELAERVAELRATRLLRAAS